MKIRRVLFIVITLIFSSPLCAQIGGQSVFNSLNIPSSARIAALGGNLISVNDNDLNLAVFNPSLLNETMDGQLSLSYVDYFAGTNLGFASYARHIDSVATFSGTMQFFNYGQFDQTDQEGTVTGKFYAGDFGLTLGAGIAVDTNYTVGANFKVLYSTLAEYYSLGAAVDLSATYTKRAKRFVAALVVKNLGYQLVSYRDDNRESLPFEIQLGISKQLKHAPFRFSIIAENLQKWDLTYVNANEPVQFDPITGEAIQESNFEFGDKLMRHLVFGGEMLLSENFNIRIGYNYRRRQEMLVADKPGTAGFSWGLGLRIKRFDISYGRAIYHLAGPSNHFTVTTKIGNNRWGGLKDTMGSGDGGRM